MADHTKNVSVSTYADAVTTLLKLETCPAARYINNWLCWHQEHRKGDRQRDIFPIPPVGVCSTADRGSLCYAEEAVQIANIVLGSLNFLESNFKAFDSKQHVRSVPTLAQQEVQRHVLMRTDRFLQRLGRECGESLEWRGASKVFAKASRRSAVSLVAAHVDLPSHAGSCEPYGLMLEASAEVLPTISQIFPDSPAGSIGTAPPRGPERVEYVKLVGRELRCGKLGLRYRVYATGDTFTMPKSEPGHLPFERNLEWGRSICRRGQTASTTTTGKPCDFRRH